MNKAQLQDALKLMEARLNQSKGKDYWYYSGAVNVLLVLLGQEPVQGQLQ